MSCYISPMTGQPSVLAGLLEAKYGADGRDRIMSYIYSDQFEEKYGNFRSPVTDIPLDSEKEPSFDWVKENLLKEDEKQPEVNEEKLKAREEHKAALLKQLKADLPDAVVRAVTIIDEVPADVLGNDELYLSMKDVFAEKGITDPALINWFGIRYNGMHPRSINSEKEILRMAERDYKKKSDFKNYPDLQKLPQAKESFEKWVEALEKYPVTFRELMLTHAVKYLRKADRRDRFVLQLSPVALQNTYGAIVNKPHEANRVGKIYDENVVATVSESTQHEPSASGKGYWVKIPRTQKPQLKQYLSYYSYKEFLEAKDKRVSSMKKQLEELQETEKTKEQKIKELQKKLSKIVSKPPVFKNQEPALDTQDKINYGFKGYTYVRVENTEDRGYTDPFPQWLGKGYQGYYIHGYNTDDSPNPFKALAITKEEAEAIWKKEVDRYPSAGRTNEENAEVSNIIMSLKFLERTAKEIEILKETIQQFESATKENWGTVDTSEYDTNRETLKKLSPASWCTASSHTDEYLQKYDNYILVVDGVTVAGVEVNPSNKTVREVTSVYNNRVAPVEHLDDVLALLESKGLPTTDTEGSIKRALSAKNLSEDGSTQIALGPEDWAIDWVGDEEGPLDPAIFYEPEGFDPDDFYEAARYEAEAQIRNATTPQEFFTTVQNSPLSAMEGLYVAPVELQRELVNNHLLALIKEFYDLPLLLDPGQDSEGENIAPANIALQNTLIDNSHPLFKEAVEKTIKNRADYLTGYRNLELSPGQTIKDWVIENLTDVDSYFNSTEAAIKYEAEFKQVLDSMNPSFLESVVVRITREIETNEGLLEETDLPFSMTTSKSIQGYYDVKTDKAVVVARNTPVSEVSRIAIHEVAHRGMLRMAKDLGETDSLYDVLSASKAQLMEKLPQLLERTGHKDLESLMRDYGFTTDSKEGELKLLMELAARWAETLVDKPRPSWWKQLIQSLTAWLKQFTGVELTEKQVDQLVGGFVQYGSKVKEFADITVEEKLPVTGPYSKTYEEAGITYKFNREESGIITGQWSSDGGKTWEYLHPSITKAKVEKFIPPPPPGARPVQSSMFPDLMPAAPAPLQFLGTPEYTVSSIEEADALAMGIVDGLNTGKELSVGTLIQNNVDGETYIVVPKGKTVEAMPLDNYLEEQKGFDDSSFEVKNVGTRVETLEGNVGVTIGAMRDNEVRVKLDNGDTENWSREDLKIETPIESKQGFQGYKFGFDSTGKGTPKGDGKDKAMREVADGFIGEVAEFASEDSDYYVSSNYKIQTSSATSADTIAQKNDYGAVEDATDDGSTYVKPPYTTKNGKKVVSNFKELLSGDASGNEQFRPAVIMLARNKEYSNKPLNQRTKDLILAEHQNGAEFVVGDMPGVDSQFIEYLQEIGAAFTIYHTGPQGSERIKVEKKESPVPPPPPPPSRGKLKEGITEIPLPLPSSEGDGAAIYASLNAEQKTGTGLVVVPEKKLGPSAVWPAWKAFKKDNPEGAILAYSGNPEFEKVPFYVIGNPFNWQDLVAMGLERVEAGMSTTQQFIMGVLNPSLYPEHQKELLRIQEIFKSGELKGKPIFYYEEKGYATHANAIDYLVNKHDWSNTPKRVNREDIGPEQKQAIKNLLIKTYVEPARRNPQSQIQMPWKNPESNRLPDVYGLLESDYASLVSELRDELGDDYPKNIVYYPAFEFEMNNTPRNIMLAMGSRIDNVTDRGQLEFDPEEIAKMSVRLEIAISDNNGKVIGFFGQKYGKDTQEIIGNAMLAGFLDAYNKSKGNIKAVKAIGTVLLTAKEKAEKPGKNQELWKDILNSFAYPTEDAKLSAIDLLFERLSHIGYRLDYDAKKVLRDYFAQMKNDPSFLNKSTTALTFDTEEVSDSWRDEFDSYTEVLMELADNIDVEAGAYQALKDWQDSSFEMDSKNNASAKLKLFMANQRDLENFSVEFVPYDPNNTEAIDITSEMLVLSDTDVDIRIGDLRRINGKKVMHRDSTPARLNTVVNSKYKRLPKKNMLNLPSVVNFDALFERAQGILASRPGLEKIPSTGPILALELLRADGNANLAELADRLEQAYQSGNKRLLLEFIRVMNLQYSPFYIVAGKRKKSGKTRYIKGSVYVAQRNSQTQTIIKGWLGAQPLAPIMKVRPDGERVIDVDRARSHVEVIKLLGRLDKVFGMSPAEADKLAASLKERVKTLSPTAQNILREVDFRKLVEEERVNQSNLPGAQRQIQKKIIQALFKEYNIDLNDAVLNDLAGYTMDKGRRKDKIGNQIGKNSTLRKSWIGQFSYTERGDANGIFSLFFNAATGANKGITDDSDVTEGLENMVTENNPLIAEPQSTKVLANAVGKHTDRLYNGVHKNMEGKQIWDYSLHSALSRALQDFQADHNGFRTQLLASVWGGNYYIQNPEATSNLSLGYLEGLKIDKKKGVMTRRMSDRERYVTSLQAYQNQGQRTFYHYTTHSDKPTTPCFKGIPRVKAVMANGLMHPDIIEAFYTIIEGEYKRIGRVEKIIREQGTTGNHALDSKSGRTFFFFPNLNFEALSEEERGLMYNPDGTLLASVATEAGTEMIHRKMIEYLQLNIDKTVNTWEKHGINLSMMDPSYVREINKTDDGKAGKKAESKEEKQALLDKTIIDYTLNTLLWEMSADILFLGDPGAIEWKGSIEKTLAEYAKRRAKDIAPRQQLAFEDETYQQLTLSDVSMKYEYAAQFPSNIAMAKKITDAQEFITVKERLKFLRHKLEDKDYNMLLEKYEKGEDFSPEDLEIIMGNGGSDMNATKPVYAGPRFVNGLIFYDYIKSSAVPLLPQFTRGTELDKLRKLMEENEEAPGKDRYARAVFESGSKEGHNPKPVSLFNSEGKFAELTPEKMQEVQDSARTLSRAHLGIQQEVPADPDKTETNVVTQLDKLIAEGIVELDATFSMPGYGDLTGKQMRELKESVRIQAAKMKLDKLYKSLNVDDPGKPIPPKEVMKLLLDSARASEFSANDIGLLEAVVRETEEGDFIHAFPLYYHSAVEKFEKQLLAKVKKITEFKLPGKSYVQVSSIGIVKDTQLTDKVRQGIVTVGDYDMSQPLQHLRTENGVVKPAQVIMPFNFHYTDASGNKVKAKLKDFMTPDGKLDTARVPKELLQLIAARIPNQGHNSVVPVEIVGFTPEWMGDVIIVPGAITEQMGSDFDVDKLFTYQRPYMWDKGTKSFKEYNDELPGATAEEYEEVKQEAERILERIGRKKEDGSFKTRDLRETIEDLMYEKYRTKDFPRHEVSRDKPLMEKLQKDYFNIHWSILNSPAMFTKIMTKLDKPDLGVMAEKYKPKSLSDYEHTYFHPITQNDMYQSGKDAKDLVGMTSLASTLEAILQGKDLVLGYYETTYPPGLPFPLHNPKPTSIELDGLSLTGISGEAISMGVNSTMEDLKSWYSKHDNITIDQTGAVDNAKDRNLDHLNITMATYPAFDAMNKLHAVNVKVGDQKLKKGLSKSFQCAFVVQDCLKEFTDEMRQAMDSLSDGEYTENLRLTVLAQLRKKYIKDARGYMSDEDHKNIETLVENFKLTETNLNRAFKNKETKARDAEFFLVQLAVLNQFEKLAEIGDRLRAIQKTFNQDTNGAGPNLLYALQQAENHDTLSSTANKVFLGEESLLTGQTEELYQATIPVAIKLLDSVFPVAAIKNVMSNVAFWKGKEMSSLSLTSQKEILRLMRSYDISTNPAISVDTVAERARLLYDSQVSESLAKRVEKLKLVYPNNPILNRLQGVISNNVKKPDFVKTIVTPDSRLNENLVIQEFAKLLTDDDADLRALGEDLIIYSQLISPQRSATSVASLVPYGYILGSDIASQLRLNLANLREKRTMPKGFYDQLVQHMPSLAVKISDEVLGANDPIFNIPSRPEYPEVLRFNRDHKAVKSIGKEDRDIEGLMLFPPYLYYYSEEEGKQILYKAIGTEDEFETNTQMYQRIDLLGDEGIVEFDNMVDGPARSLFAENRAWHEFEDTDHFYNVQNKVKSDIAATSDPENAYSRWNLESGESANLNMALEQMSADPEVPTYLRTLAATMASTSAPIQSIEAAQALGYSTQPFQVTVGSNRNSFGASKNTMTLRKEKDIKEAAISLLHETTHQRTSSILHALGWLSKERARLTRASMPSEEFEKEWVKYQSMAEDFAKKNPELYKVAKELDRLRMQAFEQLKTQLEAQGMNVDARMQQIFQDKLDTEEDQLLYAMSSLPEFIAHVLTDKGTMEFLNTVESTTPQSFVAKLIDKFLDFLTEFLNSLGFQYNEKSILKECLALSYDLIGANNTTDLEFRETSLAKQTIKFDTESKANDVEHYISSIARQEYTRTDTATGHIFEVEEFRKRPDKFTEGSALLREGVNKLSRQIQEIDNSLTRPIRTPEDRLRRGQLRNIYNEAINDYDRLVDAKQEIEMLNVARKQLQWVKAMTRKPNLHIQEATIAWQILDTWATLSETFSPTYTPSEEVQELVKDIEGTGVMLTHMLSKQSIFSFSEEGNRVTNFRMALTLADLSKIEDIDMVTAQTAALERVNDKLSQVVSTYTQYQKQTAMAEFRKLTEKLKKFKELVSEADYKKFLQESKSGAVFGLVQEIDASWYFRTASARKDLSKRLKAIYLQAEKHDETVAAFGALAPDMDLGTKEEYIAREARAAFYSFWRDQETHGTMIDTRKLLDPATGNLRTDAEAQAELARLEAASTPSIVQKSLKKAQQDYERYLEERDAKFFEIDSNPGLTDAEKTALKDDFELYNSPLTFFETRNTLGVSATGEALDEDSLKHTGRYKPWFVPLSTREENFDSKYKDIMSNPKLKEGYEILVELSEKYRSYLPPSVAESLHDNFLPVIHPQAMAETMGLIKKLKTTGVGRTMLNAISASKEEVDKSSGEKKEIPVKFVGKVPKLKDSKGNVIGVDYSKVSTDLPRMFEMFGEMAIHYNALYPADEMINMARRLLIEENKSRVNSRQKPINNLLGLLDYYQDAMVYGQAKDFNEMTSATPVYSLVPWKHNQLQAEMNKLNTELEKLIGQMLAEGVPFDKEDHPYVKRKQELESRIQEIAGQARYVSGGKIADVLMSIQQMKSMSYNPFSAFSNLSFGYMASFIHARGFRADESGFTKGDYTAAQLRKAYSMMKGNVANSWLKAFGYSHSDLSKKITAIIERTNAIEALIDTKYGGSNLTEDKSNLAKFLDPTAAQKSGDWLTKGAVIIARTLNTPVEVTTASGEVKTISLFDALNVNGEWNEKDYGKNKEWSSDTASDQVSWNKFLLRTRMVLTLVFGNQDKNMPLQARKVWWTRMMGQFRLSWIPEGVRTRWGKHQGYNEILEREIEGRYRTMLRMKGFGVGLLAKQMLSAVTGSNPFEGQKVLDFDKAKNRYVERDMKEFEIENMRRNLAGLAYTALLAAAYYALKAAVPDEEELRKLRKRGENPATSLRIAANVAYRSYQDLILYASPDMFEQITGSIVPSWGVIHDMKGAVAAWYKIATDDKYEWDKFWLKQTKAFPYLNLINKWEFYSNRDISAAVR